MKKKNEASHTQVISSKVSRNEKASLKKLVEEKGTTVSKYIRLLVLEKL